MMKSSFAYILMAAILVSNMMFCTMGFASGDYSITSLSASYASGKVTVTGETAEDVYAVAVLLYNANGSTLLRMESFGVSDGSFTAEINISLSPGSYMVKAANYAGGPFASTTFTYSAPTGGGGGGGGTSASPPTGPYTVNIPGTGNQGTAIPVTVDPNKATGAADISKENATELLSGSGVIAIPSIPGVYNFKVEIPASVLTNEQGSGSLTLSTDIGDIVIPENMLSANPDADGKKAAISIGRAETSGLTEDEKEAVGDRPLIQLALTLDGQAAAWQNPNAPVSVTIPYTPSEEELKNPESIIIWYLDGSGALICVPNGRYDPATGMVSFSTTHFSLYAVGFKAVAFKDIAANAWYARAVAFISARSITAGIGGGNYGPEKLLTRGEFIVMLMRAYDIAPDANPVDNFADAGNGSFANYLAAAKRLGISAGVGNNRFGTDQIITRQEMFTMLYNALKVLNGLPVGNADVGTDPLSVYADANEIQPYAKAAMRLFVETGIIVGNDGRLHPNAYATRAQMAQLLYNLMTR